MINSTCVWVDNKAEITVATGNDFTHKTVKHVTFKVRFLQESAYSGFHVLWYAVSKLDSKCVYSA